MTTNLLVFGAPRSGTTLLAGMLGAHPDVAMAHEDTGEGWTHIVGKPVRGVKLVAPNQIEHTHGLSARLRRYRHRLARYGLQNLGITRPGFKLQSIFAIRDFQACPNSRILAIVRDPHEGIESIRRRGKNPRSVAEYRWARALEVIATVQAETPGMVRVVYYDNLVRTPEATMRRCLDWLDLPFDERVIQGETPNYDLAAIDASKAGGRGANCATHAIFRKRPDLFDAFGNVVGTAF
mgnify:CR=1 FL=1